MLDRLLTFTKGRLAEPGSRVPRRRSRPAERPRPQAQPAPSSREDEWLRATWPLTAAIAALERIECLQSAAAHQIDAAEYTLQRLIGDLSAAMPIPPDGAPLRAALAAAATKADSREEALAA
jgi:hypothetical protein